jgi:hypothetical protein
MVILTACDPGGGVSQLLASPSSTAGGTTIEPPGQTTTPGSLPPPKTPPLLGKRVLVSAGGFSVQLPIRWTAVQPGRAPVVFRAVALGEFQRGASLEVTRRSLGGETRYGFFQRRAREAQDDPARTPESVYRVRESLPFGPALELFYGTGKDYASSTEWIELLFTARGFEFDWKMSFPYAQVGLHDEQFEAMAQSIRLIG